MTHILWIIKEIESNFPDSKIDTYIFNPSTGVFTIYYALTKEDGYLYLPNYYILVKNPNETRLYFGALEANGSSMDLPQLLQITLSLGKSRRQEAICLPLAYIAAHTPNLS